VWGAARFETKIPERGNFEFGKAEKRAEKTAA
jgi:hypothetical protein